MRRRLWLLALTLAFAASTFGQTPQLSERIDVRITNLEIVVTDRKGEPVRGLTKGDFELIAGGAPQPILNFYEAALAPGTHEAADGATEPAQRAPRHIILYLDNTSLAAQHRKKLVEEMSAVIGRIMVPGDQTMVVTFDRKVRVRLPFTRDLEAVGTALAALASEGGGGDSYHRQAIITQKELLAAQTLEHRLRIAQGYAEFARDHLEQSVAAMKTVMQTVSGIEGRKVMIFASEGLPVHPGIEMFQFVETLSTREFGRDSIEPRTTVMELPRRRGGGTRTTPPVLALPPPGHKKQPIARSVIADAQPWDARVVIQDLARTANSYGLSIYALHGGAIAGAGTFDSDSGRSDTTSNVLRDLRANTESAMRIVAEETGGMASVGTHHDALFDGIRNDLTSYYSLGFRSGPPGEREIKVRLKKPGRYIVRHRHSLLQKPLEEELADRVVANLFTAATASDASVELALGARVPHAEGKVRVPVRISVPYDSLTLLETAATRTYGGAFDIYIAVVDANGAVSPVVRRTQNFSVKDVSETKGKTFPYTMQFLMNSNARRVSVAVVDTATQLTSFATHELRSE